MINRSTSILVLFALLFGGAVMAQPNNCVDAINLGSLPVPSPCLFGVGGLGAPVSFPLTNTGAVPNTDALGGLYLSMLPCTGFDVEMGGPASDVWYQFTLTGTVLDLTITGAIDTPNVGIWQGACGALTPIRCAVGGGGTLTESWDALTPGVYFIQISGEVISDTGDFTLTLQNNEICDVCLSSSTLTATPPPTGGYYDPGTAVTFCYTVDEYVQQNANWFHGIVPDFGAGWDLSTLTTVAPPSCDLTGVWGWYPSVTSTATGLTVGPGFFYDSPGGATPPLLDGNPGNNYGDNCVPPLDAPWVFCWTVTTSTTVPPAACSPGAPATDLSITIENYADGESGGWTSIACNFDPDYEFNAILTCCTAPLTAITPTSCPGTSDGELTSQGQGTGPWDYTWQNDLGVVIGTDLGTFGTSTISGLTSGLYTLTVEDMSDGCIRTEVVFVPEPAAILPTISLTTNVRCAGATDGTAMVTPTGGTPGTTGYTYAWSTVPVQTTALATGLAAGSYTVVVTDSAGCTASNTVTITEPAALTTSISASADVTCFGAANGSATVTPAGGTAGYSYLWTGGGSPTTATNTGMAPGSYSVVVTDAIGCVSVAAVTITQPADLTASISASENVSCAFSSDGTATVTAGGGSPGFSYIWTGGAAPTSATNTGLGPGTYSVVITDANSCTETASVTITEPAPLTASISSSNDVTCFGDGDGTATVTSGGGSTPYTYTWSGGGSPSTATNTGLGPGTYSVTITDDSSCTQVTSVTITEPTDLTASISASADVTCFGANDGTATVLAGGGSPGFSYAWSGGASPTTAANSGFGPGTYSVVVTDLSGCTETASITITEPTALTSAITDSKNVQCNGLNDGTATVTPGGGSPPYTYDWSGLGATPTAAANSSLPAGTYTVIITDNNSCTSSSTVTITEPTPIVTATSSVTATCGSDDGTATAVPSGGTAPYSYLWSTVPPQTTSSATGLFSGIYSVTITDDSGCVDISSVAVSNAGGPTADLVSSTDATCFSGTDGVATATAFGGTPPFTYAWSTVPPTVGPVATGLAAGTWIVQVADANGCLDDTTVTISEPTEVLGAISSFTDVTCFGAGNGSAIAAGSGGTAGYTYNWSTGASGSTASGLAPGTHTVSITDVNSCLGTTTVTIAEPTAVVVTEDIVSDASCNAGSDGTGSVTGSGGTPGYTFAWSSGASGTAATGLAAGTYTITITDANSCLGTTSIVVGEPSAVVASASSTSSTCGNADGTALASAVGGTPGYTYLWGTTPPVAAASATGLFAGSYAVTVTDLNGCIDSTTVSISDLGAPTVAITSSSDVSCFGGTDGDANSLVSGGTPGYTYAWSTVPPQTTATATGLPAGTYSLVVTDMNSCIATESVTITEPTAVLISMDAFTDVLCNGGSDGTATASVTGGTSGYTFDGIQLPFKLPPRQQVYQLGPMKPLQLMRIDVQIQRL